MSEKSATNLIRLPLYKENVAYNDESILFINLDDSGDEPFSYTKAHPANKVQQILDLFTAWLYSTPDNGEETSQFYRVIYDGVNTHVSDLVLMLATDHIIISVRYRDGSYNFDSRYFSRKLPLNASIKAWLAYWKALPVNREMFLDNPLKDKVKIKFHGVSNSPIIMIRFLLSKKP